MRVPIKDCGKGINKDLLPSELELGVWCATTQNFRAQNGFMEKWDGVATAYDPPSSSDIVWFSSYAPSANRYVVYVRADGSALALRPDTGSDSTINRPPPEQTISTITRIGANTAELTTGAAHGLASGDNVTVFGATESGYNEVDVNITVMSSTVFRYTTTNAIAANATVVGQYVVTQSNSGFAFTSVGSRGTGCNLNGTLFYNNPTDGLYYWAGDTSARMRKLAITTYVAHTARSFLNYLIQLQPTMSGTKQLRRVLWSNAAEPGAVPTTFDSSATNDAGFVDLADTDGRTIDCLPLGEVNIVYKDDGRYAMQYTGDSNVFSFTRLPGSDGIYERHCVVNTPKGHVFLTPALDVKIHQGGEAVSIIEGKLRRYLIESMRAVDDSSKDKVFLCVNPRKSEVWCCFPDTDDANNRILAWNWDSGLWSEYRVPGSGEIIFATTGLYPIGTNYQDNEQEVLIVSDDLGRLGVAGGSGVPVVGDAGTWFGTALSGILEARGVHLDDADTFKTLHRSRWNIDGDAGDTLTIQHGSAKYADTAPTYTSGTTYTIGTTDYADGRATAGRFLALKATTTAYPVKVRSIDLDVTAGGKR
jgi:hypothetical protein